MSGYRFACDEIDQRQGRLRDHSARRPMRLRQRNTDGVDTELSNANHTAESNNGATHRQYIGGGSLRGATPNNGLDNQSSSGVMTEASTMSEVEMIRRWAQTWKEISPGLEKIRLREVREEDFSAVVKTAGAGI
jgi:hypothetical protein